MFVKAQQISWQLYLLRFNIRNLTDISIAVSIENYEIQISRSMFHTYPSYLYKISFLKTLDIYKNYFKGRLTWCKVFIDAYCDRR